MTQEQAREKGVYLIQTDVLPPQPLQPLVWKLLQFSNCVHQLWQTFMEHPCRVVRSHKVQQSKGLEIHPSQFCTSVCILEQVAVALTCYRWCWGHRGGWVRSPPPSSGSACSANTRHARPLPGGQGTLPAKWNKRAKIKNLSQIWPVPIRCYKGSETNLHHSHVQKPLC